MSLQRKTPARGKAFWPVAGFLLALASAALAFVFTNPVIDMLRKSLRGFPNDSKVPIIVGVILFAVFVMIFSLIVAITLPKRKSAVNETQMIKDRKKMVNEKMARKIKQREINRQGKAR